MCDSERKSLERRARIVRVMYAVINLYALALVLAICLHSSCHTEELRLLVCRMFIGAMIFIPVSPVVLWFLNKPCRAIHTKPQRIYLIVSRVMLTLAWILACVPIAVIVGLGIDQELSTKRTTNVIPIKGGHELIVKTTTTPGFLQGPNIKKRQSIRWASGRKEELAAPYFNDDIAISNVLEARGYVFLEAGQTLFYRQGTIASVQGNWQRWKLWDSDGLSQYDAKSHHEHYYVKQGRVYLPHRIESIDPTTLQIVMVSDEVVPAMPKYLVFSATGETPVTWVFDEEATRKRGVRSKE